MWEKDRHGLHYKGDAMRTEREREGLSSLLDGEASELELRRVLRDLDDDAAAQFGRWQLASDILRGQPVAAVPDDFSARLQQALADEAPRRGNWLGHLTRVAVAAGVAAATVTVGWQYWGGSPVGGPAQVASAPMAASASHNGMPARLSEAYRGRPLGDIALVGLDTRPQAAQENGAQQGSQPISPMLLRHSEMSARHGGQGMLPYVRLVNADALRAESE